MAARAVRSLVFNLVVTGKALHVRRSNSGMSWLDVAISYVAKYLDTEEPLCYLLKLINLATTSLEGEGGRKYTSKVYR